MLEKPDLDDAEIRACLRDQYELHVIQVAFLPLGADPNAAVYRVTTEDNAQYFLKLRRGGFEEAAVTVPKFLSEQGIAQIIPPIATRTQQLWTRLDAFHLILYPFIEGRNGFEVNLTDQHWIDFGLALKAIHTVLLPPALIRQIPQEIYSPQWREVVKMFQVRVEDHVYDEPVAAKLAAFLQAKRAQIHTLGERAEQLSVALQARSPNFVLCHSDIHAGNILIDTNDSLYIVDWDNPILAPKECDLMFVGGGVGGVWHDAQEAALFYQGYGQTKVDPIALAYYRYERILQDIAVSCKQIFLTREGGENRLAEFRYFTNQFLPHNVVEIAYQSAMNLPPELNLNMCREILPDASK